MINTLRRPSTWVKILAFAFGGWLVASTVFGFNNPTAAPAGGFSAITADPAGNVGVGVTAPTVKLDVNGDIKTNAGITLGGVRRTDWPSGGGGGGIGGSGDTGYIPRFIDATTIGNSQIFDNGIRVGVGTPAPTHKFTVNGDVRGTRLCIGTDCRNVWPSAGAAGVSGSGTSGKLTKWVGATSVGNSSITENITNVTFTKDIVANTNAWGAQSNVSVPQSHNASGYWGGPSSLNWVRQCPGGSYMIGLRQDQTGGRAIPGIICAKL